MNRIRWNLTLYFYTYSCFCSSGERPLILLSKRNCSVFLSLTSPCSGRNSLASGIHMNLFNWWTKKRIGHPALCASLPAVTCTLWRVSGPHGTCKTKQWKLPFQLRLFSAHTQRKQPTHTTIENNTRIYGVGKVLEHLDFNSLSGKESKGVGVNLNMFNINPYLVSYHWNGSYLPEKYWHLEKKEWKERNIYFTAVKYRKNYAFLNMYKTNVY